VFGLGIVLEGVRGGSRLVEAVKTGVEVLEGVRGSRLVEAVTGVEVLEGVRGGSRLVEAVMTGVGVECINWIPRSRLPSCLSLRPSGSNIEIE
jgi:hypothetical protein